jgi:ABC-2 type transport system permease protein
MAILSAALPGLLVALSLTVAKEPPPWDYLFQRFALPMWAVFLFPMSIALLTAAVAQIEYRSHAWDHLFALPIPRPRLFAAKTIVVVTAAIGMTLLAMLLTALGGVVGGALTGHFPQGEIAISTLAYKIALFLTGSTLALALQLWVSLRFRNFVVPLAIGVIGTLVGLSVFVTGIDRATWFPWVLPLKLLSAPQPLPLALLGLLAGLLVVTLMIADLSHRCFR